MVQVEEAVVLSYCDALVAGEDALLADAGVQTIHRFQHFLSRSLAAIELQA